jgi:XTP/dITP diphosphohydrolase
VIKPIFVTGNKRKIWQAQESLKSFGTTLETQDISMDEIQSTNPEKIVAAKAKAAFASLGQPVVVNDHSWSIAALHGFPGGYMKDMNAWLTTQDFLNLMKDKQDQSAILTETVAYYDGTILQLFSEQYSGSFISKPRGQGLFPSERIFIFNGSSKTIAEHIDKNEHARVMDHSAWVLFANWYSGQA